MNDFNVGDTVFYVQFTEEKIGSRIIQGIDIVDGHPRYWLQGYFGYFDTGKLYKTHQQAQDRLDQWKIIKKLDEGVEHE